MIPRLTMRTLFQLKEQMRLLLPIVKASNMWILNNSVSTTHETIKEVLGENCEYLVDEKKGGNDKSHGWHLFDKKVKANVKRVF
eukprot:UN21195